jgi:KaiC/GvpD/RAD55 family RecA-like ATPase
MTADPYGRTDSGEKIDLLLKKIAWLEDMILMESKVHTKKSTGKMLDVLLQGKATIMKPEVLAGEIFDLEIEVVNFGRIPVTLHGIEEIIPCCGMELMTTSEKRLLEGSYLDLNGKTLEPSMTEKLKFTVRALRKGIYAISPRVVYMVGEGIQKILGLNPATVEVKEVVLPGRVNSGYMELDNLLFGGLPEKYSVALTSISCDETKLLVNRFVEKGARGGEITFLITVETRRWKKLAEEFPNVSLFVCNPQAETTMEALPNVVKIRGVESLTDINIPLFSALRKLGASNGKPRRICIEIVSDILLQHRAAQTRRWLSGLITELRSTGFTILALMNPYMHPAEDVQAVLDLFDGEMEVYESANQKFLRIRRMYEQDYIENELPLRRNKLLTTGVARELRYHSY